MNLALGFGLNKFRNGALLNYSDEAKALFARMTVQPSNDLKTKIDTQIKIWVANGVWAELDAYYFTSSHDLQSACLNWKQDAYNLTPVNNPTFTAFKGFTGDGSTSYIDTNLNPTTAGLNYTQNSALFGIGTPLSLAGGAYSNGAVIGGKYCWINPLASTNMRASINGTGASPSLTALTNTRGYSYGNRVSSTTINVCRNKTKNAYSHTSTTPPNGNLFLCAANNGTTAVDFNVLPISHASIGASLSDEQFESLIDGTEYLMDEVGNSLIGGNTNVTLNQTILPFDIIAGQSNAMQQFSHVGDIPSEYAAENKDILQWDFVNGKLSLNKPGLNTVGRNYVVGDYIDCWGSEQSFLYAKKAVTANKIGCIKNALGATKIDQWAQPSGVMWVELKAAIEAAIADTTAKGATARFDSLLWIQGESDIVASTAAATYEAALIALINAIRGIHAATANMMIVIVKMPLGMTGLDDTRTNTHNAALDNIAAALTGIYLIDTNAMSLTFADNLHYTPASTLAIGQEWYDILNP